MIQQRHRGNIVDRFHWMSTEFVLLHCWMGHAIFVSFLNQNFCMQLTEIVPAELAQLGF